MTSTMKPASGNCNFIKHIGPQPSVGRSRVFVAILAERYKIVLYREAAKGLLGDMVNLQFDRRVVIWRVSTEAASIFISRKHSLSNSLRRMPVLCSGRQVL